MRPRRPAPKQRNREERKTALLTLLVQRRTLDGLDVDGLAHSYGLPADIVKPMLEGERLRREFR